jgi:hypothetical protein
VQANSKHTQQHNRTTCSTHPQHTQQPPGRLGWVQVDIVLVSGACTGEHRPNTATCTAAARQADGAVEGWAGQVAVHGGCLSTQVRMPHSFCDWSSDVLYAVTNPTYMRSTPITALGQAEEYSASRQVALATSSRCTTLSLASLRATQQRPRHSDAFVIACTASAAGICIAFLLARLAPLSEGRVEAGTLMCSYHGWKFDSQGKCVDIPQVSSSSLCQACT